MVTLLYTTPGWPYKQWWYSTVLTRTRLHPRIITSIITALVVVGALMVVRETAWAPQFALNPPTQSNQPAAFDKQAFSTTDPASLWVIINKQHPLRPQRYAPA